MPTAPEWSINGTTAENGKRFRFKRDSIGDYLLGYAAPGLYSLASAMAVSAAFPGGFGPLTLKANDFVWKKRPWGAPKGAELPVAIGYTNIHLYDGGVYDNLGLEPFFDAGSGKSKIAGRSIVVSDAGAPLAAGFSFGSFSRFRLKRMADIMADQAHALRVRTFWRYLNKNPSAGALLYIGPEAEDSNSDTEAVYAAGFPTTLRRLNFNEFDRLGQRGYDVAALDQHLRQLTV